jgi:4-diphosphocytidyl-2-C-methyl-D-erythritol kinase
MRAFALRAFAKINLSLRVTHVREDGFHEVRTILQTIDLSDRLKCDARRGPFEIRCEHPGVPVDRTNLIWKAADQLWNAGGRSGEPRDVMVALEKHIPVRAGLGGGSSDAAAALVGLRRAWKLRLTDADLVAVAAGVGSDVPYFLVGGTALGLGRGEEVYPLADLPPIWAVLVTPAFGVATKDAYAWWDAGKGVRPLFSRAATPFFPGWLTAVPLANDLEPPVVARYPVIGEIKQQLLRRGAIMAAMSGSGSTVFGLFRSRRAANTAARALTRSDTTTHCVRFLQRQRL